MFRVHSITDMSSEVQTTVIRMVEFKQEQLLPQSH